MGFLEYNKISDFKIENIITKKDFDKVKIFFFINGEEGIFIKLISLLSLRYLSPRSSAVKTTSFLFFIRLLATPNEGKICPPVPPDAINIFF